MEGNMEIKANFEEAEEDGDSGFHPIPKLTSTLLLVAGSQS